MMQSVIGDRIPSRVEEAHASENRSGSEPFETLLETFQPEQPKRGQFLRGIILQVEPDSILLDVGAKCDAIVPRKEMEKLGDEALDSMQCGEQLPVYVLQTPRKGGKLVVSIVRGYEITDWDRARSCYSTGEVHVLEVIGANRGGLVVRFGRLRGFIPNSHISGLRRNVDHETKEEYKESKIGAMMQVSVIDVDQQERRLVLSARAAERALRQKRLRELETGQVIEGEVVNIVDYGVFVDLGGVDGLLHISELDNRHLEHPSEVVELGEVLKVKVLNIEMERERVGLSRKALMPSPWDTVEKQYGIGDLVEGVITNVRDFGAFIMLPGGVEGLIHESEMGIAGQGHPSEVVEKGERVIARVVHIEPQRERMGLSLRQVTYNDEVAWMAKKQGTGNDEAEAGVLKDISDLGRAYQMQYGNQTGEIEAPPASS